MVTLKRGFFLLLFCTATAKTLCQNHQSGSEQEVEKADGEEGWTGEREAWCWEHEEEQTPGHQVRMKLALLLHLIKHLLLLCNSWFSTMKGGHVCDPIRSYQWRITVLNKTLLEDFTVLSSHSADIQTDPPYNIKWIYPKACHGRTWAVVTVWERCGPIVSSTIVLVKLSLIDCVIWRKLVFKAAVWFFTVWTNCTLLCQSSASPSTTSPTWWSGSTPSPHASTWPPTWRSASLSKSNYHPDKTTGLGEMTKISWFR